MRHLYIFHQGSPEILEISSGLGKTCLGCGEPIESKWDYLLARGCIDHGPMWHGEFCNADCLESFANRERERGAQIIVSNGYGE